MSKDLINQLNNTEEDEITIHKSGNLNVSDKKYSRDEIISKRQNRMVIILILWIFSRLLIPQ